MENIPLFLISISAVGILVTNIVMLTKIVKTCNILLMIKNVTSATYELFGGIAPETINLDGEDFPESPADADLSIGGLE